MCQAHFVPLKMLGLPHEFEILIPVLHGSQQDETHHFPLGRDSYAEKTLFGGEVAVVFRWYDVVKTGSHVEVPKEIWDL